MLPMLDQVILFSPPGWDLRINFFSLVWFPQPNLGRFTLLNPSWVFFFRHAVWAVQHVLLFALLTPVRQTRTTANWFPHLPQPTWTVRLVVASGTWCWSLFESSFCFNHRSWKKNIAVIKGGVKVNITSYLSVNNNSAEAGPVARSALMQSCLLKRFKAGWVTLGGAMEGPWS